MKVQVNKKVPMEFFADFKREMEKIGGDKYLTRDELRYRIGSDNFESTWEMIKLSRGISCNLLPYEPMKITYNLTPQISEELHLCDQDLTNIVRLTGTDAQEYVMEALSDEAIASSKLEGAVTTELVAKQILRKNITPKNKDEQMIVNNHHAMQFIRDKGDILLSPEFICEIQRIVTQNTLDNPDASGIFRTTDNVRVVSNVNGEIIHYPPKSDDVPHLISALCEFVNADRTGSGQRFVHPLIVGIALHFLIGYIHPFYDGNGRTARTLFYWYLLSRGYKLFEYIPISKVIKKSPAKYRDAYLATENDELDLTYFIQYNVSCIQKARKALIDHIDAEKQRRYDATVKISQLSDLNNKRQGSILQYMFEYKDEEFSIPEIAERFDVTYQTARTDLMHLEARGYLWVKKRGRAFYYSVDSEWRKRLGL